MKRSTCLSGLLVGLSIATASVASAAPEEGSTASQESADQVAQQQPTDGSGTAPTAAAPAGGDGAQPAQPAVTIGTGTSTPAKDQPQAAAEEPEKKPKPRAWAGTQIFATTSMTTATVFRGQQQDYNPTVESALWLLPRYRLSKDFQLRGRTIINYEYTNSDTTVTRNEPVVSDTTLQLFYNSIPEIAGIKPQVALNVGLPTSKVSRSRTMLFSPGATLQLVKGFEHVIGGEIMLLGSLIYSHPIYRSRNAEASDPVPYAFQCLGGNNCQDIVSGVMNPSDVLAYAFLIAGEWGKWSPALYYLGSSQWTYGPKEVSYLGRPVEGPAGFDPVGVRQTSYFSAWLDYHANSWLTPEVGYWLSRSALTEAGTRGNPFFDRYQDMRVYLGFNVNIDNLMQQLEGNAGEAGVVRAQNTRRPFFNF